MQRRRFLALGSALPWGVRGFAAAPATTADLLANTIAAGTVPGAGLVAARDGVVRLEHYAGTYCSPGDRRARLTAETMHPLYSFSKLVTATLVGIAQQEGRLDFGDSVVRHIPEFTGGGRERITLRHCLTHAAGLSSPKSMPVYEADGWKAALDQLCAAEVEWAPGSRTAYHAWTGAFLAAECVRRVYGGRNWTVLAREKLFAPLNATSLSFDRPQDGAPVAIVPQTDPGKPLPASTRTAFSYAGQPGAGCFGTLADALKVLQLHLPDGASGARRVLTANVRREIHTVQYAQEIRNARAAGRKPEHEPWGLGPLLRGEGAAISAHRWFGFSNQATPEIFGHAGIDTFIGVADPRTRIAFVFAATHSPQPAGTAGKLRVSVTDAVFAELR